MSKLDRATLLTEINVIKNETEKGANTATRVGNTLLDIVDSVANSSTATGMDLDNDNFTIQNAGVYFVSSYPSYSIYFPDALLFDGCNITIINYAGDQANITGLLPKALNNDDVTFVPSHSCWQFISINGKWFLINQYGV